jgi:hypothetical protein
MTFYQLHDGPLALQRFMRESVGTGLRERYKPEQDIPKVLMVLLGQLNHYRPGSSDSATNTPPEITLVDG